MKKIMFIVFGILFGFESNMFGYTWGVLNNTGDRIGINFCVGFGTCQNENLDYGAWHDFNFDGALLLQTVTISNVTDNVARNTTHVDLSPLPLKKLSGGVLVIKKDSSGAYIIDKDQ